MKVQIAQKGQFWAEGTGYAGCFPASLNELQPIFGTDNAIESGDYKVSNEWQLKIDGQPVTIYDYKEETPPKFAPNKIYSWHIGGLDHQAPKLLREYFRSLGHTKLADSIESIYE